MKVNLVNTPDIDSNTMQEVYNLLNSTAGPLKFFKFVNDTSFVNYLHNFLDICINECNQDDIKKILNNKILSFNQLFDLCNYFRNFKKFNKSDYVVLITGIKNELNWFSCFNNNNIFIHADDWEFYLKAPSAFPIAYQVMENIIQQNMRIDLKEFPNKYIHLETLGCVNDFCQNKKEILIKLRTADICINCLEKLKEEKIDEEIIHQALNLFEIIRKELLFKQGFYKSLESKKIKISKQGEIYIGNVRLKLNPLEKTLYIFFLLNSEGVSLNELENYKEFLIRLYKIFRPGGDDSKIINLIKPKGLGTFSKNKSSINSIIRKQIPEPIAQKYFISGNRGGIFKINIQPNLIQNELKVDDKFFC